MSVFDLVGDLLSAPAPGERGECGENPRHHWRDDMANDWRMVANSEGDSGEFAMIRHAFATPQTQQPCGDSHNSPRSPGVPLASDSPEHEKAMVDGIRYASAERLATDRRACGQCLALEADGRCGAARRRQLPGAAPWFSPSPETLHRCIGYRPGPDDPDQRPGRERWPGLARRLLGTKEAAA